MAILVIFGANLGPIDFKIGFYIEVNIYKREPGLRST